MSLRTLKILLAEDVHMIRGALVALLELQSDFQVVGQVERGDAVLPASLRYQPDVAILDIDLPGLDGLSAAAQLHQQVPSCHTLILTGHDHPGVLRRSLRSGASGVMLKCAPPESLANAVREVAAGRQVVDPQVAQIALASLDPPATAPLSPREIEVLELTAKGNSAKEIANRLYLATGTVRNYLTSIATKLQARTRVDAVRIARDAGWIP